MKWYNDINKEGMKMDFNEMIYGLTKLYSEIKYNYGMFNRNPFDLEKVFKDSLVELYKVNTKWDYYKILCKFVNNCNDPHSYVKFPNGLLDEENIGILPFDIKLIDDRWYINSFQKTYENVLSQYDEILEINGMKIKEYFENHVYPYVNSKSYKDTLEIRNEFVLGPVNTSIKIKVKSLDNKISEICISRVPINNDVDWLDYNREWLYSEKTNALYRSEDNCFEIFEDGDVGMINIWSFTCHNLVKDFLEHIELLRNKKAIIIDLRENCGGSSNPAIDFLSLFTDKEYYESMCNYRVHNAYEKARAYFKVKWEGLITFDEYNAKYHDETFKDCYENYYNQYHKLKIDKEYFNKKNNNIFTCPVVVLVSRNTASAAESFLGAFRYIKRGIIIGERTIGAGSQPLMIDLPYDFTAAISTEDTLNLDGTPFNNIGHHPDINVNYHLEDYLDAKKRKTDKEYEEALKYFKKHGYIK